MKRKTFIAILAIAMVLVLSLAILTACNSKKHDFSSKWEYDETSHWHECMTKKHSDVADKADHTFNAGVVTTQPTEAAEGVKTLTCTVCGYQKTESVPKLEHTFDMGNWKFDEQTHWHPATCAHTDLKKDEAEHVWNEGVITTHPTETTEGVKTYTCTVCGNTKTATIGMLDHEHTFDMERWDHDAENHWHPATCAHTSEKKDLAAHNWNAGVITKPADYGVEGEKTFTCTVCKATRVESVPATPPKYNTLTFDGGLALSKTYDGTPVVLNPENVHFNGNGALTIEYKLEDESDSTYTTTAPTDAGEYIVRATVAGTAEWYGTSNTKSFTIMHRILTLSESVYSRKIDQNLESGKFGLECKNVAEETNNTLTWVTVEVPAQYRTVGIHNMRVGELIVDNPNYMFAIADETNEVRLTVWDAPEFYAGVQETFYITGRGTVLKVQIAIGTVNVGDQLYSNELG